MVFERDDAKPATNRARHGVSLELAQIVWDYPCDVVLPDRIVGDDHRWHAVGMVGRSWCLSPS